MIQTSNIKLFGFGTFGSFWRNLGPSHSPVPLKILGLCHEPLVARSRRTEQRQDCQLLDRKMGSAQVDLIFCDTRVKKKGGGVMGV